MTVNRKILIFFFLVFAISDGNATDQADRFNARSPYDALVKFIQKAEDLGLARKVKSQPNLIDMPGYFQVEYADGTVFYETSGISKAITDGRFNPHFDDLLLAYEGIQDRPWRAWRNLSKAEQGERRKEIWNRSFGKIANYQAIYLAVRFPPADESKALPWYLEFERASSEQKKTIERYRNQYDIVSFFSLGETADGLFDFRKKYEDLRTFSYLPLLAGKPSQRVPGITAHKAIIVVKTPKAPVLFSQVIDYYQYGELSGALITRMWLPRKDEKNPTGLRAGDVIRSLEGKEVKSGKQFRSAFAKLERKRISVLVDRNGEPLLVELDRDKATLKWTPDYAPGNSNICTLRAEKDGGNNLIFVAPIDFLINLGSPITQAQDSILSQAASVATASIYHTLPREAWCRYGAPNFYVPVQFLSDPESRRKILDSFNNTFARGGDKPQSLDYFAHNNSPANPGHLAHFTDSKDESGGSKLAQYILVAPTVVAQPDPPPTVAGAYTTKKPSAMASGSNKQPEPVFYKEHTPSPSLTNNSVSSNPVEAFVIFFANSGMLLEFGDEIFCTLNSLAVKADSEGIFSSHAFEECRDTARQKIAYIETHYALIGIIGAILGYVLLAPLKVLFAKELSVQNEWRGIFKTVFKIEMVEASVCVVGQVMTDGNLAVALFSLVIGFGSGVVRGGAMATMHSWKYNPDFRFQVGLWAVAVISAIVYFFNITEF